MKLRINFSVLLISTLIVFYSCQGEKPTKEKKRFTAEKKTTTLIEEENTGPILHKISQDQFEKYNMKLGTPSLKNINESITSAGYIEVPNESIAEVRTLIGGYLGSSPFLPGDYVKKGQFLISLENLEYIQMQQDYLQAKEDLNYLKAVYERQKVLAEEKISSQNKKQQAESEYKTALANYEGLRKKLNLININPDKIQADNISSSINLYSPIDGYLTEINAVNGMFAEPTDVIFEIINTDHLHIELKVYEKDILKVSKGQEISFRIPEANSESFSGKVFMVGKTIEPTNRTVSVHCHIDEESKIPVVIGMYIEATIYHDASERLCLPVDAFVREEGKYFMYINKSVGDDEYLFEKIMVEVGYQDEECFEILGLSQQDIEGKEILIDGAFDL